MWLPGDPSRAGGQVGRGCLCEVVSVSSGYCVTNVPRTRRSDSRRDFSCVWSLDVWPGARRVGVREALSPVCEWRPSRCELMGRERSSLCVSSKVVQILPSGAPPHVLITPNTHLLIPSHWGEASNTGVWGAQTSSLQQRSTAVCGSHGDVAAGAGPCCPGRGRNDNKVG